MEIIAHRGASGAYPEHTLLAYEKAVEQNADGVECDIRMTADGHLLCFHDRTLNRTTDGFGLVSTTSIDKIRTLNAGTWEDPQPVLEFDTFLEFVEANPNLSVFIETKHPARYGLDLERKLAERLRHHGLARDKRVHVISFATRSVAATRSLLPRIDSIQLVKKPGGRTAARRMAGRPTHMGVAMAGARSDPAGLASWKKKVYCWLARTDDDVRYATAMGINWLATDWPAHARKVMHEQLLDPAGPAVAELTEGVVEEIPETVLKAVEDTSMGTPEAGPGRATAA